MVLQASISTIPGNLNSLMQFQLLQYWIIYPLAASKDRKDAEKLRIQRVPTERSEIFFRCLSVLKYRKVTVPQAVCM
jgi:hypothetical protein